jgi:hypothetical protein
MTVLEAAIDYISMGMSVIPLAKDKKPLISWLEFQKRKASEDEVRAWFDKYPDANIGIVTGCISDLTVVDCDSDNATEYFRSNYQGETPVVKTPKGTHFYFKYKEGVRNAARILPDTDIRSEGGYVVAPPSSNGTGLQYVWTKDIENGCDDISTLSFFSLTESLTRVGMHGDKIGESNEVNEVKTSQIYFREGRRNEDIFTVSNILIKLRMDDAFTKETVRLLARSCKPPYPENEIEPLILSAMQRQVRREKSVKEEINWWLESKTGQFQVKDYYNESNVVKKEEKHAVIVALKSLCTEGILESCGNRSGTYRKIEKDFTLQQWWNDEGEPLPLTFPLGVGQLAKVYAGNMILLEGQKSQGKSAFALEFCRMNRNLFPNQKIRYQNVEMADSELIERFRKYPPEQMTLADWKTHVDFIKRTGDWWDLINPDGINVVDYLIEYEKSYMIADFVWKIHQKLKTGICLVLVQRDPLKPYPAGGRAVRDIPRLVMSLIHHKLRLEDVKSFWFSEYGNPTGLVKGYKQVNWHDFQQTEEWRIEEEQKYDIFKKK